MVGRSLSYAIPLNWIPFRTFEATALKKSTVKVARVNAQCDSGERGTERLCWEMLCISSETR